MPMFRQFWPRFAAFAAGAALLFCTGAGIAQQLAKSDEQDVTIDDFAFGPRELTVAPGTKVVWVNKDEEPHTVTSVDNQTFKSPALGTDDKFSFVFEKPGTYRYFCSIHPRMAGEVIVK
jgi:plastocyanin